MLFFLATLHGTSIAPGEIFGDVRLGDKYLADVALQLKCGEETVEAKTDSSGSFRLRVKEAGACKLTATYAGQSPTISVVVFDHPTRYRFVLEEKDGKYQLKRS